MEERDALFLDLVTELQGYDLTSVANAAEVSYSTPWNWLYGPTVSPRLNTLIKVGKAIGMSLEWKRSASLHLAA